MKYSETFDAYVRSQILLSLYFALGYTLPRPALRDKLELTGIVVGHAKLAAEISWLHEIGLVETPSSEAVRLTERGEDIALGRSQTPGVRRPSVSDINGS